MSADPVVLDAAVRGFRDKNPMRWESGPCICFGCIATIMTNYRGLLREHAASESHVVRDRPA